MQMAALISIVTVTYKDAWAFTKTARSIFQQKFQDFEYVVVDGNSNDGTQGLVKFWKSLNLIDKEICEADHGVYDAMNKGALAASGEYICFMNAGDVFSDSTILDRAASLLSNKELDGCLGWGELGGKVWASWNESPAFKLSSLGFCHQALFVKRSLILEHPFDDRPLKTDSDTLQLGRLYEAGANIPIIPEVWALRGAEPGISADLERSQKSIIETLTSEYKELDHVTAEKLLSFRRSCNDPDFILKLTEAAENPLKFHLGCLILDTLCQRQSKTLSDIDLDRLQHTAISALASHYGADTNVQMDRLIKAQHIRKTIMSEKITIEDNLKKDIWTFRDQEAGRIQKVRDSRESKNPKSTTDYVISLTSFPARIQTLPYVIQSLIEQTFPPKEIHLNIGSDEVPNKKWLPSALLAFEAKGLIVNFVPKTFHQYDKFMHNSHLNKQFPFVIVDDDVIYPPHSMETLIRAHETYPTAIIANRAHLMKMGSKDTLENYSDWQREVNFPTPSLGLLPTGAGGVLYPKDFLTHPIVTDTMNALAHAPYADDIWLKFCALALGVPVYATNMSEGSKWYHRYTPTMRAGTLMAANVELGLNDLQIKACSEWLDNQRPEWRKELAEDIRELK